MVNRLAASTSPYLLQHADNPVDWQEWGRPAFAEAHDRDVPIILSVGYAACHWCHVMAHDSFEDEGVAAVMNDNFVNIKVDREERPDVDAVYMEAVSAMTGHAGWPMTCVLTPDGAPFYAGTFFPRAQFTRLLVAITELWRDSRDEAVSAGQRVLDALAQLPTGEALGGSAIGVAELNEAADRLLTTFDQERGGFGGAPKFPPSMVLEFLLRHYERTGARSSLAMVARTCVAMARGGMYDQLAGGFARYSVDADWVVPHFEKMLYDNALLLRVYLHWWRITGDPLARRIADETAAFLLRDLRTPQGGFASALDADTDGVEGATYAWTPAQLVAALGVDDGAYAAALCEVTPSGTFEHGASTLQLRRDPDDPARWASIRQRLVEVRDGRPQPSRDDKVVTSWNALAISGLAEAGLLLDQSSYLDAARGALELILGRHRVDERLRRTSRDGRVGEAAGVADDYGNLAEALLIMHQVSAEPRWLSEAGQLLDVAVAHFADGSDGFYDTADDAEQLVRRPQDPTDNATPAGSSALITALVAYYALTESLSHRAVAEAALARVARLGTQQPRFLGWALAAAEALVSGPLQIAVVGESGTRPLTAAAWLARPGGAVVVSGAADDRDVPLLRDRPLVDGQPAAYVCRGMVCERPVGDVEALLAGLARETMGQPADPGVLADPH
jgi:uncharacterized protein YyaL (SSP411 family)